MEDTTSYTGLEIAIIGIACRFPGSVDHRGYWHNLVNGVHSASFFSDEELKDLGVSADMIGDKNFVRAKISLQNKDRFDSFFFDYRPNDAKMMNPQHRIFHECVWEALEDAGCNPDTVKAPIGLYAGAGDDLGWKAFSLLSSRDADMDGFSLNQLNNKDFLASLVSYKLNLKGPSYSINTACSTSLVAVHMACRGLLLGETGLAIAGGVSLTTEKQYGYLYHENMIVSNDGYCRAFDKNASGTVPGEGAGVVVLKRLKDALRDGDQVYVIIKGSATNNDGNRKVGYTAPSVKGQAECIKMAHRFARVEPETISYVEAHGTATRLGDPIEIEALNIAFNKNPRKHCAIGSVKTNIGHLNTAAGIAGLIKTALSLKYKMIPPSLHYNLANPEIDFDGGPFYVNTQLKAWQKEGDTPLRAAVSSFGIGGTNAHVIMEEPPKETEITPGRIVKLLTLSARTETALARYARTLLNFVTETPEVNLDDMSYTLGTGRKFFEYRAAIAYRNKDELTEALTSALIENNLVTNLFIPDHTTGGVGKRNLVFMFPGVGSQYVNMGRDLYLGEPVFKAEMDKGFSFLKALTGEDYKTIIYPASADDFRINSMLHTQPTVFLLAYSLARLLVSWGIKPAYMIGHSLGEYVAACLSGVFSYEDALRLVVKRGQLMNAVPEGAMLSVSLSEVEGRKLVNNRISIAAINSENQLVLSGDLLAIEALKKILDENEVPNARLHSYRACHSYMMDEILEEYADELGKVIMNAPEIPFISNMTGRFMTKGEANSVRYWTRHLRETVNFASGINALKERDCVFVELGGNALTGLIGQGRKENASSVVGKDPISINLIRHPKEAENDLVYLLRRIGRLWMEGFDVDWSSYYSVDKRKKISLPTYSFEPTNYPVEVDFSGDGIAWPKVADWTDPAADPAAESLKDWLYYPVWKNEIAGSPDNSRQEKGFLFFSLDDVNDRRIAAQLKKNHNKVIEIISGETFSKESANRYIIDPSQADHIREVLVDIRSGLMEITDVLYSWTMAAAPGPIQLTENGKTIYPVYLAIANVARELLRQDILGGVHFSFITDTLYKVIGNEKTIYGQSLALGLINVLPQEYSVSCVNIDLDRRSISEKEMDQLVNEISSRHSVSRKVIALRHGQRWVQEYQRQVHALIHPSDIIKSGGVYLITGGLGNVGFVLAKYLLERYAVKLIITGRTQEQLLGASASRLDYLRTSSTDVYYSSVDVSDLVSFRQAILTAEEHSGPVQGVIHTAGNTDLDDFRLIQDINEKNVLAMMAAKVSGINNIYTIFRDRGLDFVWMTSSLSGLLGGLSFGSYSAANLYMDHFTLATSEELSGWKSIALSEMIFDEEAAAAEVLKKRRTAITPAEIILLFEWSLSVKGHCLIVETVEDLDRRINDIYVKKDQGLDTIPGQAAEIRLQRPLLSNRYIAPETTTEKTLARMIGDFFGMTGIGVEDNFLEIGGDSLKAMYLLKKIEKEFNTRIKLNDFFKAPNIKALASEIDNIKWLTADIQAAREIVI